MREREREREGGKRWMNEWMNERKKEWMNEWNLFSFLSYFELQNIGYKKYEEQIKNIIIKYKNI